MDPACWESLTNGLRDYIVQSLPEKLSKIIDCDLMNSKKTDYLYYITNGNRENREWLIHWDSKECFY